MNRYHPANNPLPRYPDNCPKCGVAWEVCTCFQEPDMAKLCETLRLALQRQRSVNETLVKALEGWQNLGLHSGTCACLVCARTDAALAAAQKGE